MTKLMYLEDTNLLSGEGVIVDISRDDKGYFIVLDQTVFYPQGGGQPADKGQIEVQGNSVDVIFVGFLDGHVRHYLPDTFAKDISVGQRAKLHVSGPIRMRHAALHTGGHLVSHVMETIDSRLIPIKGYHFPDGSYVEFANEHGVDGSKLIEQANEGLLNAVSDDLAVSARLSDFATISAIRPALAPFTPKDKPTRIVTVGDFIPLPCGGTHLGSISQLSEIRITKVKNQKGNIKVSYQLPSVS